MDAAEWAGLVAGLLIFGAVAVWCVLIVARLVREERRHLLEVLDRFASRSFADYQMGQMLRREVEVDQGGDDEAEERAAIRSWLGEVEGDLEAGEGARDQA